MLSYHFFPGLVIGFLIKYLSGNKREAVTHTNCTISTAPKKLYISTSNALLYSCTLSGVALNSGIDQGSELMQMVGTRKKIYMLMIN